MLSFLCTCMCMYNVHVGVLPPMESALSQPVSSGMGMGLGIGTGMGTGIGTGMGTGMGTGPGAGNALITKTDGKNRAGFDYLFTSLSPQYPTYSR